MCHTGHSFEEQQMKRSRVHYVAGLFLAGILAVAAGNASATVTPDAPHDAASGITCIMCHASHPDLGGTGYNNICLNCHRPGVPKGGAKPYTAADFANPFATYTATRYGTLYQTSHNWQGSDTVAAAGAVPPIQAAMTTNSLRSRTNGKLACVRCHNQHSNANPPFLRIANDQDQLCLDCHRPRNTTDHKLGTHPVGVTYASWVAAKPGSFATQPNDTALTLKNGKVFCSTCHSAHYTDSRSGTLKGSANFLNLSTGDGNLLNTALHGAKVASGQADRPNLCNDCHLVKVNHNYHGQNVQCGDCHGGHVDPGDGTTPNVRLVNRYINFSSAVRSAKGRVVFFQSTSVKNYMDSNGNGICQACHDVPTTSGYQFHLTQTNATCNDCHTHNNPLGTYSVDPSKACGSCHGYPPRGNTVGGPTGYAAGSPFTNESSSAHATHAFSPYQKACNDCHLNNTHNAGTFTDVFIPPTAGLVAATGGLTPTYTAGTFTCSNVYCHSNGAPRTGTVANAPTPVVPPAWNTGRFVITGQPNAVRCNFCHAAPIATNSHTTHINAAGYAIACAVCHSATVSGADFASTVISTPTNHVNGQKDIAFSGTAGSGSWTAGTATCTNVYCHSTVQGAGGSGSGAPTAYSSPVWGANGTVGCGSCHTNMATDTTNATGSHKTHAQAPYNFSCAFCHGTGYTSTTIVTAIHVNNSINLSFTGTATTAGATPSYYGGNTKNPGVGYQNCQNVYCHSTVQGAGGTLPPTYKTPTWGNAASVGTCGGCHVNMAVDATGSGSHYFHANTGGNGKYACTTCHFGAGKDPNTGVATPNHANGTIDISFSAKGTGTTYSLGSHVAGSGYGTCSSSKCHGAGTPTWGANTSKVTCEKCHGSAATNPFYSTNGSTGNTVAKVGAHTAHLQATHGISSKISCSECHTVPALVNYTGHMNGTADVVFNGTLARSQSTTPTNGTTTCNTTWCHGGNTSLIPQNSPARTAPVWTTPFPAVGTVGTGGVGGTTGTGLCSQCHGYPPATAVHLNKLATDCTGCHTHVNAAGTGFSNPALHINGTIEGGDCVSCHSIQRNTYRRQVTGAGGDIENTSPGLGVTDHHLKYVGTINSNDCAVCHDQANHTTYSNGVTVFLKTQDGGASVPFDGTTANNGEAACVSCHNAAHAATTPFSASGDTNSPVFIGWSTGKMAHSALMACFNCHGNSNPAQPGTTLSPRYNGHGSATAKLLQDTNYTTANNTYCYNCHGAASTNPNKSIKNIETPITQTYGHGGTVCFSCHDKHKAKSGTHTQGSSLVSPALNGMGGKIATWSAASVFNSNPNLSVNNATFTNGTITRDYQLCFNCHTTSIPVTGPTDLTDLSLEFNPNNKSYHPVTVALGAAGSGSTTLSSGSMSGAWTAGVGKTMTCADCHGSDGSTSTTIGPHGSTIKWMLTGTNKAWPYTSAANNGTSAGTFFTYDTRTTNQNTNNGLFCLNCHTLGSPHTSDPAHQSIACVGCHIRVPHGGKVSRLINTNTAGRVNRYSPDGAGGGTIYINKFSKPAGGYSDTNCYSTAAGCGQHNSASNGTESW